MVPPITGYNCIWNSGYESGSDPDVDEVYSCQDESSQEPVLQTTPTPARASILDYLTALPFAFVGLACGGTAGAGIPGLTCDTEVELFNEQYQRAFASQVAMRFRNGQIYFETEITLPGDGQDGVIRELRDGQLYLILGTQNGLIGMENGELSVRSPEEGTWPGCEEVEDGCSFTSGQTSGGALVPVGRPFIIGSQEGQDRAVGSMLFQRVDGNGERINEYMVMGRMVDNTYGHDVFRFVDQWGGEWNVVRIVNQYIPDSGPPEPVYEELYFEVDEYGNVLENDLTPFVEQCLDENEDVASCLSPVFAYYNVSADGEFLDYSEEGFRYPDPSLADLTYEPVMDENVTLADIYEGNADLGLGGIGNNLEESVLPMNLTLVIEDARDHRNATSETFGPEEMGDLMTSPLIIPVDERFTAGGVFRLRLRASFAVDSQQAIPELTYIYQSVLSARLQLVCEGEEVVLPDNTTTSTDATDAGVPEAGSQTDAGPEIEDAGPAPDASDSNAQIAEDGDIGETVPDADVDEAADGGVEGPGSYFTGIYPSAAEVFGVMYDQDYADAFVRTGWTNFADFISAEGAVVRPQDNMTVSEAIAYGMMFAAVMDDQATFDRISNWAETYMRSTTYTGLLAWICSPPFCAEGRDEVPSPDAEIIRAVAYFFASERWGDGDIAYSTLGNQTADAILTNLTAGDAIIFSPENPTWRNPSYEMPAFFRLLADYTGNARWDNIADNSYDLIFSAMNPTTGLLPNATLADGSPVDMDYWRVFSYDAMRTPYNIAMDQVLFGLEPRAQTYLDLIMGDFFSAVIMFHGDEYALDGTMLSSNHDPSFVGSFAGAAMGDSYELDRAAFYNHLMSTSYPDTSEPNSYYQTAWMLWGAMLASGNFRTP